MMIKNILILKIVAWFLQPLLYVCSFLIKLRLMKKENNPDNLETPKKPKTIVITGASQGIGQALVEYYYQNCQSCQTIVMISRSREKLENLKQQILLSKKTIVEKQLIVKPCDVTNKDEMIKIFNEVYNTYNGIDIVFANAGVSFRDLSLQESFDSAVRNVFNINVNGVINTILPIIDLWKKQVNTNVENNEAIGQLVIISSQAAHAPFVSPIYGSTKECVRALGFDLRHLLVKYKICVNIVSPGPVLSPMLSSSTAGMKSLACTQEQAASYIYHGLKGNPAEIVFPYFTAVMQFAIQYLPDFIQIPIAFYLANGIMKKTKISKVE